MTLKSGITSQKYAPCLMEKFDTNKALMTITTIFGQTYTTDMWEWRVDYPKAYFWMELGLSKWSLTHGEKLKSLPWWRKKEESFRGLIAL